MLHGDRERTLKIKVNSVKVLSTKVPTKIDIDADRFVSLKKAFEFKTKFIKYE